jgi:7-cyano-7-deazaguanine synthase
MKRAVVLLSGGMDSAVTLYIAKQEYSCRALIFDYGQKGAKEVDMAVKTARQAKVPAEVLTISMPWKGSALLDAGESIPEFDASVGGKIPSTYVPARNMLFLSYGVSYAESIGAKAVFIGAHQLDFSNYPDCRSEFFSAFQEAVKRGTREGVEGHPVKIMTPVIDMTKKEILNRGTELGVPFENTWSCYKGEESPCGTCESCLFRARAFKEAGVEDPLEAKTKR